MSFINHLAMLGFPYAHFNSECKVILRSGDGNLPSNEQLCLQQLGLISVFIATFSFILNRVIRTAAPGTCFLAFLFLIIIITSQY